MIPVLDLVAEYRSLKEEIDAAVARVLSSGGFIGGAEVEALERALAELLGVTQVVTVASGTDALILGLRALGVGPGDEVITTPFTFVATVEAILHVGARPVLIDIDPRTFNLDPSHLAGAYSSKTRALLPVHLFGQPAPMRELRSFAQRHGLALLEDAAQAIGAREGGQLVGSLGDAAAFSLYPTKNLGAYGDGGFVSTSRLEVAEEVRLLAAHGSRSRYLHERPMGYTSRLDALQAAIIRVKLPYLASWTERRRAIARHYTEQLSGLVETPWEAPEAYHVYHQYTIRLPERDRLAAHLKALGIGSSVHYPRAVHEQPAYRDLAPYGSLPEAERAGREVLSLPLHPFLTDAQVEQVIEGVRSFFD